LGTGKPVPNSVKTNSVAEANQIETQPLEVTQPAVPPVAPADNSVANSESQLNGSKLTNTETAATLSNSSQATLTPAQIAEHRRISALSIDKTANETPISPDGFKNDPDNNLLTLLSSPITAAVGAGAILLLLLAWLLLARRQEKLVSDNDLMASLDNFDDTFQTLDDEIKAKDTANTEQKETENFFRKLDSSTSEQGDSSHKSSPISKLTDAVEDDDILQEADVYIVYGLHEQAEAELKKAIQEHPQKLEYRQKLLENYLASDNQAAFDQHAEELNQLKGNNKKQIWEKVLEMGFKINPDNSLYQAAKPANFDKAEQDTTLETAKVEEIQKDDSDNDSQPEPVRNESAPSALTLIDTQFAKDENFSLDDLEKELDAKSLSDNEDDFSLDDLEKELDAQANSEINSESRADDDSSNIIDFESVLTEEEKRYSGNTDDTENNKLSLASLNLNVDSSTGIERILPKGTPYTSNITNKEQEVFSVEEDDILAFLDLPDEDFDLHEAHISTKLELARAYLDMGDIEGARSTLEEVIVEGSDDQKREAEDLLHQTG
jgi:pilus assembly protein FimV